MTEPQRPEPEIDLINHRHRHANRDWRLSDRVTTFAMLVAFIMIAVGFAVGYTQVQRLTKVTHSTAALTRRTARDEHNKVVSDRVACRKASVRTAADVNLNWTYYLSERDLASGPRTSARILRDLALLKPEERRFIEDVLSSGSQSRRILRIRANADFQAAFQKAWSTVDVRDAKQVQVNGPLGHWPQPRRWVLSARYNCDASHP